MSLNKYQQALVEAVKTEKLVIGEACPGSGKTRTMEEAVSELILSGVDPSRIGVFTFSRKSAAEARRRIALKVIPDISKEELDELEQGINNGSLDPFEEDPVRNWICKWICTIHAMSYRILKENGHKVRVPEGKQRWDAQAIVKDGIKELEWDESPKSVWRWIAIGINNMVPATSTTFDFMDFGLSEWQSEKLSLLYSRYIKYMRSHSLVDFDMMQADLVKMIRSKKIDLSGMFDYVFIDEAQDNNQLQNEIIQALTKKASLIMIGDVDQALYSFRGARPEILRSFKEAVRFNLPINYRSSIEIVTRSSQLISYSYNGDDEFLKPFQYRPDAPSGLEMSFTTLKDFKGLTEEIKALLEDTEDVAILSRTRAECSAIHQSLIEAGIPAINHSGGLLFGAPHIRKVLAYARLACNYKDARNDLEILGEIANVASASFKAPMTRRRHVDYCDAKPWFDCGCPVIMREGVDYSHSRFYGQKAIEEAGNWAGVINQQLDVNKGGYPSLKSKGATDLVDFIMSLEGYNAWDTLNLIIDDCVLPWLKAEDGISEDGDSDKEEDFSLLLENATGKTLEEFLDHIEWLSNQSSSSGEAVNIGTIHWSKGAEFKKVIVNLTRCPLQTPKQDPNKLPTGKPPTIEEERRLAFVAVTRAREECHIVASREWLGSKLPVSQFIGELQ